MAIAIKEDDLKEMKILWENHSGNTRLVRVDERNLEIIIYKRIGESGRGRKGEIRDCWCSIPSYHSTVSSAFCRLLEMDLTEGDRFSILTFRQTLEDFKKDFLNQISGKV